MLGYLELYRTALYGLHVCQDGLVGKLRSYNSAVRAKDVERVRKIARDIEVLHQNQHQFFKVFGVQSHFILNNTSQDNCCCIFSCITGKKEIADPVEGVRIIEPVLGEHLDIFKDIKVGDINRWLRNLKENPRMCTEYILLIEAALMVVLTKNYEEVIKNYENFSEKLTQAFNKAREVFGRAEGIWPTEYSAEINRDDAEKRMNDAVRRYIRENIDPYTYKAYR